MHAAILARSHIACIYKRTYPMRVLKSQMTFSQPKRQTPPSARQKLAGSLVELARYQSSLNRRLPSTPNGLSSSNKRSSDLSAIPRGFQQLSPEISAPAVMNPPPPNRSDSGFTRVIKRCSFKKEAEASPKPSRPNRKQDEIPVYELAIDDLRGWLRRRFPGHSFDGDVSF